MDVQEEPVIQLHGDEQEGGEVFLGEVPEQTVEEMAAHVAESVESIELIMPAPEGIPAAEAFAQAAQELDADKAGDAAKPQYQPSIPGILPAFDWRRAQLLTESLEETVASAERVWEALKKQTAGAKSDFDDAVESLRTHIQQTHRARVDAEFQTSRTDSTAPADVVDASACAFERTTGKPCPICRNPREGLIPADNTTSAHVAGAAVNSQASDQLEASGLRAVIRELSGVELQEDTVRGWSAVERAQVLAFLELPLDSVRPPQLGTPHEAAEPAGSKQACRICGAPMPFLPEDEKTWPIGQHVGIDCPGEPGSEAEPTRITKPRHAGKVRKPSADHGAEQKAEGTKKAAKGKGRKK